MQRFLHQWQTHEGRIQKRCHQFRMWYRWRTVADLVLAWGTSMGTGVGRDCKEPHQRENEWSERDGDLYALQGEREGWLRQQWWAVGIILAPWGAVFFVTQKDWKPDRRWLNRSRVVRLRAQLLKKRCLRLLRRVEIGRAADKIEGRKGEQSVYVLISTCRKWSWLVRNREQCLLQKMRSDCPKHERLTVGGLS